MSKLSHFSLVPPDSGRRRHEVLRQLPRHQRPEVQILAGQEDLRPPAHQEQPLPGPFKGMNHPWSNTKASLLRKLINQCKCHLTTKLKRRDRQCQA